MFEKRVIIAAATMAFITAPAFAATGYSLGAEYSEGDYGTGETTSSWYIPFSWRYGNDSVRASITIPYLYVSGSTLVTFDGRAVSPSGMGTGMGGGGGSTSTTHTDSGLGDVLLSGSYQLLSEGEQRPWMGATAKVKLATADADKGLGTGENDYSLQLEMAKAMVYGYAGYRWLGDTATVDYDDVTFFGIALNFPLGNESGWGVEYYTESASLSGMDAVREVTLSLGGAMSKELDYSLYYTSGMTDASADSVIGVNFSTPLK